MSIKFRYAGVVINRFSISSIIVFLIFFTLDTSAQLPTPSCSIPTAVRGEQNACTSATSAYLYKVEGNMLAFPGSSVTWEIPEGGYTIINSDPFGVSKTIRWTTSGVKTIKIYRSDCPSHSISYIVNVANGSLDQPSPIIGPIDACIGTSSAYSVNPFGSNNFVWKLYKNSAFDTSTPVTQSGNQVTINWNSAGQYLLMVYYDNGACKSPERTYAIQVGPPSLLEITPGYDFQCINSTGVFQISARNGQTYFWSVTPSNIGSVTQVGNSCSIAWGNSSGYATINVDVTNSCGTSRFSHSLAVNAPPPKPVLLITKNVGCKGESIPLSISNYNQQNQYSFEPQNGFFVVQQEGYPNFRSNVAGSYTFGVRDYTSGCASPISDPVTITVIDPNLGPRINGGSTVCKNTLQTYSVISPTPGISYTWRIPAGIAKMNNNSSATNAVGNSVTIEWLTPGVHTLQLVPSSSSCGDVLTAGTLDVTVQSSLDPTKFSPIDGSSDVCLYPLPLSPPGSSPPTPIPVEFPYSIQYNGNVNTGDASNYLVTWNVIGGGYLGATNNLRANVSWTDAGTFEVRASIQNSCTAPITKVLTVIANATSEKVRSLGFPTSACPGSSVTFNVEPSTGSYRWQTSGTVLTSSVNSATIKFQDPSPDHFVSYIANNGICDERTTPVTVNVYKRTQTITGFSINSVPSFGSTATLSAVTTSGLPITYYTHDADVNITGANVTFNKTGTATLFASQNGGGCYLPASDKLLVVDIGKGQQTITFPAPGPLCIGKTINLPEFSSAGLNITYISSNPGVASVSGNILSINAAGPFTISASQPGNANYHPAEIISRDLQVNALSTILNGDPPGICDETFANIQLASSGSGSLLTWTVKSMINGAGASAGTGATINQKLSLTNKALAGSVVYSAIATFNGCPGPAKDILVAIKPIADLNVLNKSICSGMSTNLPLASTPTTSNYSWVIKSQVNILGANPGSGPVIDQVLTVSPSGTPVGSVVYSITSGGCSTEDVTVTVNALPSVNSVDSLVICSGQFTNIPLASNPTGATFDWTITTNNVMGGTPGIGNVIDNQLSSVSGGKIVYSVSPTRAQCSGVTKNIQVRVKPLATVTVDDRSLCSGGSTGIALSSNVAGSTFSWVVGSRSTSISGASAGSGININHTLTNSSLSTSGEVNYIITPIPPSTACAGPNDELKVTVNPKPTVNNSSKTVCSGEVFTLQPTSSFPSATFTWTATPSKPAFVGLVTSGSGAIQGPLNHPLLTTETVTYNVTPYAGTCAGTPGTIPITVRPYQAPSISGSTIICSGSPVSLTANPSGGTYLWSTGQTTRTITRTTAGLVTVTVTHPTFCSGTASINLTTGTTPLAPTIGIGYNGLCSQSSSPNALLYTSAADAYQWSTGATSPTITVYSVNTYSVTITKNGCKATGYKTVGCGGTSSMAMTADVSAEDQGIKKKTIAREGEALSEASDEFTVYPNPSDNALEIEIGDATDGPSEVALINQFGQVVIRQGLESHQRTITIEIKHLPEGMYLLQLEQPLRKQFKKVMILHN